MKRMVCFLLTLILALSLMSFGFARSNMTLRTTLQTSKVGWGISRGNISQIDQGADQTCDSGLKNARTISEGKDVGTTALSLKDTNKDGVHDTLQVEVSNAYPSYYNRVNIGVKNFGEIGVKVCKAVINWGGSTVALEDGHVYYLHDGALTEGVTPPNDAVLEVCWTGSSVDGQPPGKVLACNLEFHLLPGARQNHSYRFEVTMAAEAAEISETTTEKPENSAVRVLPATTALPITGGCVPFTYLVGLVLAVLGVSLRRR